MKRRGAIFRFGTVLSLALCATGAGGQTSTERKATQGAIRVIESAEETNAVLQERGGIQFGKARTAALTIRVDDGVRYQTIDGFGASLTDSSAWLLWNKLSEPKRKDALRLLFDAKTGIGLSLLRQPMGASDFALEDYSYDDVPAGQSDPELKQFSIAKDERYIVPILREALAINPKLKIIGSPWSPPGWMKTSQSMIQGALLPTAYKPLAMYFVKFVEAYEKDGIPIYAVTMQNEPLNVPGNYPGMDMTSGEQAAFLRDALGPALRDAKLNTKVLIFDHNWDLVHFPIEVLSDAKAAGFAGGIAIHCYGGSVTAQSELHERFPDKDIWLTECSGGDWQKGKLLESQVRLIIDATRNWSRSVILWNLALDQYHEPFLGGCTTCRGVITVKHEGDTGEVIPTVDYTALGHASKFVQPGAVRVESNSFGQNNLEDVAFRNPDGSIVLLVMNSSGEAVPFNVEWNGQFANYTLKANTVATLVWAGAPHP